MMGTIPKNGKKILIFVFCCFLFVQDHSYTKCEYLCHQYFLSRKHTVSLLICNSSKIELVIIDSTTKMKIVVCCYCHTISAVAHSNILQVSVAVGIILGILNQTFYSMHGSISFSFHSPCQMSCTLYQLILSI